MSGNRIKIIRHFVKGQERAYEKAFEKLQADLNKRINLKYWQVLMFIYDCKDEMSSGELCKSINEEHNYISASNAYHIINYFFKNEFLDYKVDRKNPKQKNVHLSHIGREIIENYYRSIDGLIIDCAEKLKSSDKL